MAVFPEGGAAGEGDEHAVEGDELEEIDGERGEEDAPVAVPGEERQKRGEEENHDWHRGE